MWYFKVLLRFSEVKLSSVRVKSGGANLCKGLVQSGLVLSSSGVVGSGKVGNGKVAVYF